MLLPWSPILEFRNSTVLAILTLHVPCNVASHQVLAQYKDSSGDVENVKHTGQIRAIVNIHNC